MVGDLAGARRTAASFLSFCRRSGYRLQLPTAIRNAALVVAHSGRHAEAVQAAEAALLALDIPGAQM